MRLLLVLGFAGLFFTPHVQGQWHLDVQSVPPNTPPDAVIHIAGNFNGWAPGDAPYALHPDGDGTWSLSLTPPEGRLEFKFTRGNWAAAEGNAEGGFQPNRALDYDGTPTTTSLDILSWDDLMEGGSTSTAGRGVQVLTPAFDIPQLDRSRTLRIYTPPGYGESEQRYRVMYVHDGQNAFDAGTSFSGEWRIDETLDSLHALGDPGCIVVAIDNGGEHRFYEYNPYRHPVYGGDEGDAYVDFLVETLKPWVDAHYRTLPDRDNTAIAGSSMGGLISMYAGFREPETFSRLGVFSPAYWTADPVFEFVREAVGLSPMRVCTVVGEREGPAYVGDVVTMDAAMTSSGLGTAEYWTTTHADGEHAEWYWAREFAEVYQWLWADENLATAPANGTVAWPFSLSWSEGRMDIQVRLHPDVDPSKVTSVELLDPDGRRLVLTQGWKAALPMGGYGPGFRVVRVHMTDGTIWSRGLPYP